MKCFLVAAATAAATVTSPATSVLLSADIIWLVPIPPTDLSARIPGHAKHWGKHCREYKACGERVFCARQIV